jgi:energy-coupling factor transport system permease protein
MGFLLSLAFLGELKARYIFKYLKLFWPIFLIIFLLHLFYHDGTIFFNFWFLEATDNGFQAGTFNLLRFLNFMLVAICFFSWTSPLDISGKFANCMGLSNRKFFQDLALVFFIAMRFMPVLVKERETVRMAMKARGADFGRGYIKRIRMNLRLLLPIFSRVVGQTDDVASTLALKGHDGVYIAGGKAKSRWYDLPLMIIGILLTVAVIYYE